MTELVNQGAAHRVVLEHRDDVDIGHARKLEALL
jgi:hypothetical protein